jgi:hypothetical protein
MNPLLDHKAIILSIDISELHRVGINRSKNINPNQGSTIPNKEESPNEGGRYKKTKRYKKTRRYKKIRRYIITRKKL